MHCVTVVVVGSEAAPTDDLKRPVIQTALFANNFTIGAVVSVCLVKLFCQFISLLNNSDTNASATEKNRFSAECMRIISSMIHLARSGIVTRHVNSDTIDRMWTCLVVSLNFFTSLSASDGLERMLFLLLKFILLFQMLRMMSYAAFGPLLCVSFHASEHLRWLCFWNGS